MSIDNALNSLLEKQNILINMFNTNEAKWDTMVSDMVTRITTDFDLLRSVGFYKKFYINVDKGDDTNDGSIDSPLKTIKRAIDQIPISGQGDLYLASGQNFLISEDISIPNKIINLISTNNNEANIKFTYHKIFNPATSEYRWTTSKFILMQCSTLGFNSVNIETSQLTATDQNDPTVPNGIDKTVSVICPINSNGFVYFNDSSIEVKSFDLISQVGSNLINVSFSNCSIKKNVSTVTNNAVLFRLYNGHLNLSFEYSTCQILENKKLKDDLIKIINPQHVKLLLNE